MPEHITQIVLKALFAQNKKMKTAIGCLSASSKPLTMEKVLMVHGEEVPMNQMDTGSLTMTALLAIGSVKMDMSLEIGPMTMDLPQLELGGSKEIALGLELGPQMSLIKPLNTIAVITENLKNTPAPISMMAQ